MASLRRITDREQSANPTSPLHRSAQVASPHVRTDDGIICSFQLCDQIPPIVNEFVRKGDGPCGPIPTLDSFENPPPLSVIAKSQTELRSSGRIREAGHREE